MTLEELKAEAKRQGYKLIKEKPYIALEKCPKCGKKPRLRVYVGTDQYQCDCTNRSMGWYRNESKAKEAWNERVKGEKNVKAEFRRDHKVVRCLDRKS